MRSEYDGNETRSLDGNDGDSGRKVGGYVGKGSRRDAVSKLLIRTLHNFLIDPSTDGFISGEINTLFDSIELDGAVYGGKGFFVPFDSVIEHHVGRHHAFYGKIDNVKLLGNTFTKVAWLNSGKFKGFSILLSKEALRYLPNHFGFAGAENITGCNVLVIGVLHKSPSGKLLLNDVNLNYMDIRMK